MTKIVIKAFLLCCLLTTIAYAGDSYLCVADMATGFSYNKALDKWETANFNVEESKYVVSKSKDKYWQVKQIGKSDYSSSYYCNGGFSEYGFLSCSGLLGSFNMNRINLRYIRIFSMGYYNNTKDTPFIEIGKCSPLP